MFSKLSIHRRLLMSIKRQFILKKKSLIFKMRKTVEDFADELIPSLELSLQYLMVVLQ